VFAGLLAADAGAVVPFQRMTSSGPITSVVVGNDLSCQLTVQGNPQPSFEPIGAEPADCGVYIRATNTSTGEVTLFGPSDRVFLPNPDQPYTPDTGNGPDGQQLIVSGPTSAVSTRVLLGTTGLAALQTDILTNGSDVYGTNVEVINNDPAVTYNVTVFKVALCYLQGGTGGDVGFHNRPGNAFEQVGCVTEPGVSPARSEGLDGFGEPLNWVVEQYGATDTLLRAGAFPNTCLCGQASDLLVALSWTRDIGPGQNNSDMLFNTRATGPQGGAAPVPEKTGTASTESGTVLVQAPGGQFVPLAGTQSIPVGSLVDTTKGVVRLTAAASGAKKTRTGSFGGGVFRFTQKREKVGRKRLLTARLGLRGGNFGACKTRSAEGGVARRRVVRYLKAKASGRFSVIGKYSKGVERGTRWTTSDTCGGTLTKVQQGKVEVFDFGKRKTVVVKAGRSYLARPR
jgi:hypothetical protein